MLINTNNDQNISRLYTKMSESLSAQNNNARLLNVPENLNYFSSGVNTNKGENKSKLKDDSNLSYDHMYASNTENGDLNPVNPNCQTAESEVKFLKEWLLLHLELIQQQNDEILSKEKTIIILQQENEMLKERISCMERGSPFRSEKFFNSYDSSQYLGDSFAEDMTQDSANSEEDNKDHIQLIELGCENSPLQLNSFRNRHDMNENERRPDGFIKNPDIRRVSEELEIKSDLKLKDNFSETLRSENSVASGCNNAVLKFNSRNFSINSSVDADSLNALQMNIRRKRFCSNSSAVSNNDSTVEEKRSCSKVKRRRKRYVKDNQVVTCSEQYVTQTGEVAYGLINEQEVAIEMAAAAVNSASLEVPRWRVKVYTSCYTMEGTENLDDEVYNKRHSRLENDERRRKRWDVQRIREQRVVDKLKQRQDRTSCRSEEHNGPAQSLWPTIDDIRYLEVCDQLPVSAFGFPIPQFSPSEFTLPWLTNPTRSVRKVATRKAARRKGTKR